MDWTDFQVFAEVARTGSLTEAGRSLGMSTPTVRRRLDALETACGFTLFKRGPLGLRPTAVGLRLLGFAAEANRIAAAVVGTGKSAANRVSVAAMELVTEVILAPAAMDFFGACPGVAVTLESHRTREALTGSSADMVILASTLAPNAAAVRLGDMEVGLYAHRSYLDSVEPPETVEDLAHHRVIGPQTDAAARFIFERLGVPAGIVAFSFRSDSSLAQIRALTSGGGVTAYYAAMARRNPDLVRVLPTMSARLDLWLWWPAGDDREAVKRVSRVVIEVMGPYLIGGGVAAAP